MLTLLRNPPVPTFSQPVLRVSVASGRNKFSVFGVGDQSGCQPVGLQKDLMARHFIIKAKRVAIVTNVHHATGDIFPAQIFIVWFAMKSFAVAR